MTESRKNAVAQLGSRAGISLAETLVMLVIAMTAVLGIVSVSVRVGRSINSSHLHIAATATASQQIEQLVARPYDQVSGGSGYQDGVTMTWTVQNESAGKLISMAYRYQLPRRLRHDTLTAVRLKPGT